QRAGQLSQRGLARLLALEMKQSTKYAEKNLFKGKNMSLRLAAFGKPEQLKDDVILATIRQLALEGQPLARTRADFEARLAAARQKFQPRLQAMESLVVKVADALVEVQSLLLARADKALFQPVRADIAEQIRQLTRPGFLFYTPSRWLEQYPRYVAGIKARIEKSDAQIQKDHARLDELKPFWERLNEYWKQHDEDMLEQNPALQDYRWMLEEYRLSLFAQPMKTSMPISAKRLDKQWDESQRK